MKQIAEKKIPLLFLGIYIYTLFIFNFHTQLNIISQTFFVLTLISFGVASFFEGVKYTPILFYLYAVSIVIIAFMSMLWSRDLQLALSSNLTTAQLMLLAVLTFNILRTEEDIKFILDALFYSGVFMCLYALYHYGLKNIKEAALSGTRLGGTINQENVFGFLCAICFFIGLHKIISHKNFIVLPFLPLLILFGFLSGSRKAVFIYIVMLPVYILLVPSLSLTVKISIGVIILIAGIVFITQSSYASTLFKRMNILIKGIFGRDELDTSASTRFGMMKFGLNLFKKRPFYGYGSDQYRYLYGLEFGTQMTSHNNYIQVLVSYGIFGFLIYYSLFAYVIYSLFLQFKNNKNAIILLTLMVILAIHDFGADTMNSKIKFIILAIAYSQVLIKQGNAKVLKYSIVFSVK